MATLYGPPPNTLATLLDDPAGSEFADIRKIIGNLSGEQATLRLEGWPYSIAQVLAHINANLKFNLDLTRSTDPLSLPLPDLWPKVEESDWERLVEAFLVGVEALVETARHQDLERILYPETATEPAWTVGYKLASVAKHNAYHLGQIALLQKLITPNI